MTDIGKSLTKSFGDQHIAITFRYIGNDGAKVPTRAVTEF